MSEEKYKNMGLMPSKGDASISFILLLFFRSASITFIFSSKVTLKGEFLQSKSIDKKR